MIKTSIINLAKKLVFWDKSLKIYANGEGNDYPERMEIYKNLSNTAKMASNKFQQFVIGKGFGQEIDDIKLNGSRLIEVTEDITRDITDDRGTAVLVTYDGNLNVKSWKTIPFKKVRLGEKDDKELSGKILVYEDWCAKKIDKNKVRVYDTYNPNKEVLKEQIERDGGILNYKGQVLFYNMDRQYYYPLHRIDAVYKECDNEDLSSTYKNRMLRFGFFGKTLFITRKLIGKDLKKDSSDPKEIIKYRDAQSERGKFKEAIKSFVGVNDTGNAMHVEVDFSGEKLEDAIVVKNIESKIDDKLFEYTDKASREAILMAYNNLPKMLITDSDSSVFGSNGGAILEAKKSFQENVHKERDTVERISNEFYLRMEGNENKPKLKIIKLITDAKETNPMGNDSEV